MAWRELRAEAVRSVMDCSFWLSMLRCTYLTDTAEKYHDVADPEGLIHLPIPAPPEVHRHLPAYAVYKTHCAIRKRRSLAALMGPKRCAHPCAVLAALKQEVLSLG